MDISKFFPYLERITKALENNAPVIPNLNNLEKGDLFIWQSEKSEVELVTKSKFTPLSLLKAIDQQKGILLQNTLQFAAGYPANNTLLWGARGMGKSSLIKAIHTHVNLEVKDKIALIEIHREDIETLPLLMRLLKEVTRPVILFCDDLSFDAEDSSYKSLKAVLEGGVEGKADNVIFYATSNRRHLMPRDANSTKNEQSINPKETTDEKVSLSDRFGLWLGFHSCTQNDYLEMIEEYINHHSLKVDIDIAKKEALTWSVTRGARSGRVAWQFICDLAGRHQQKL